MFFRKEPRSFVAVTNEYETKLCASNWKICMSCMTILNTFWSINFYEMVSWLFRHDFKTKVFSRCFKWNFTLILYSWNQSLSAKCTSSDRSKHYLICHHQAVSSGTRTVNRLIANSHLFHVSSLSLLIVHPLTNYIDKTLTRLTPSSELSSLDFRSTFNWQSINTPFNDDICLDYT